MFLIDLVQLRRERGAPLHAEEGVDPGRELRLAAQDDARRVAVDAYELVRRGRRKLGRDRLRLGLRLQRLGKYGYRPCRWEAEASM